MEVFGFLDFIWENSYAELLNKILKESNYIDEIGENVVVTCSIGVVFADEEREEVTLKVLTKSADKAMYQAKNSGKNRYSIVRYGEK